MKHYNSNVPTDCEIVAMFPNADSVQSFVNILSIQRGTNEPDHQPMQLYTENFAQTVADTLSSLSAYNAHHHRGKYFIIRRFGRNMLHVRYPLEHKYRSAESLKYSEVLAMIKASIGLAHNRTRQNAHAPQEAA